MEEVHASASKDRSFSGGDGVVVEDCEEGEHKSQWDHGEGNVSLTGETVVPLSATSVLCPGNVITNCLKFENTFDKSLENEHEFYENIEEDFHEKGSDYGVVEHIHVDINAGIVYMRFDSIRSSQKAYKGLHGKKYDERVIKATYMDEDKYRSKFLEK